MGSAAFFFAVSLGVLACALSGEAAMMKLDFHCPTSLNAADPAVPVDGALEFGFELPANGLYTYHSKRWNEILASMKKSKTDFGPCIWQVMQSFRMKLEAECPAMLRKEGRTLDLAKKECEARVVPMLVKRMDAVSFKAGIDKDAVVQTVKPLEEFSAAGNERVRADTPKMTKELAERCTPNVFLRETGLYWQYYYSKEFMENSLPGVLEKASERCRAKILKGYMGFGYSGTVPLDCVGKPENDVECARQRESLKSFLKLVSKYLPDGLQSRTDELVANCLANPKMGILINALSDRFKEISACVRLEDGETQDIRDYGYGAKPFYRLMKKNSKHYVAEIDLRFKPESQQEKYLKLAQGCLTGPSAAKCPQPRNDSTVGCLPEQKGLNELLALPGTPPVGRLEIKLVKGDGKSPPPSEINIKERHFRSNSENWEADINCDDMTHEMMHLLGLIDEYKESATGYVYRNGKHVRLENVYEEKAKKPKQPAGDKKEEEPIFEYACRRERNQLSIMNYQGSALLVSKTDGTSPLLPDQWTAITLPGCVSENREYAVCAKYAYLATPQGKKSCPADMPEFCKPTPNQAGASPSEVPDAKSGETTQSVKDSVK